MHVGHNRRKKGKVLKIFCAFSSRIFLYGPFAIPVKSQTPTIVDQRVPVSYQNLFYQVFYLRHLAGQNINHLIKATKYDLTKIVSF